MWDKYSLFTDGPYYILSTTAPVSSVASRRHLRFADTWTLDIHITRTVLGIIASSVKVWNLLSANIWVGFIDTVATFAKHLKNLSLFRPEYGVQGLSILHVIKCPNYYTHQCCCHLLQQRHSPQRRARANTPAAWY